MAKAATPTTVTIKHLAASLAETHEVPKKQAETILNDLVGLLVKHLKKGERIRMAGLGILQVRKRAARMGRNPATGEPGDRDAAAKGVGDVGRGRLPGGGRVGREHDLFPLSVDAVEQLRDPQVLRVDPVDRGER